MKKIIAMLCACAAAAGGILAIPNAVESAVPVFECISPKTVAYNEAVFGSGTFCYLGQSDITSPLPLVIKRFMAEEGDSVAAGDVIAQVDKQASAGLIESLGQVSQLAVAAANLSTAVSLIPDEITSDRSGKIISTAGNGAAVESGYSIATIAGSDTLIIAAAVSELDIAQVKLGQKAKITCAAYPDEVFTGTVAKIASAARSQYNGAVLETVVDVLVAPDKPDERLKSGLSADVEFLLSDPHLICVVPYEAIAQDDKGEYVYVWENGTASRRSIYTGAEFSDGTEVIEGIKRDEIMLSSPEKISENSFIRVSEEE